MQWGFQYGGNAASYPGNQYGNVQNPWQYNSYGNQAYTGGTGSKHAAKRDHASAFSKPRATGPRTPAPPAVPSFGNPLPSKPPPSVDTARKPNKKKRKHNQLGLTPKTEEHESSEEEDDVDEESKLAGGDGDGDSGLKFTYRGRTSTLQSPADIAAWIAERKKKFPTQARVEEKKKAMEEAKKAREEAAKQRELQREESKRLQKEAWERKEREKHGGEDSPAKSPNPADAAAKAKLKADRLRRKLMKEERRIAKAEADAERARLKVEALQKGSTKDESGQDVGQDGHLQPANEQEAVVYQGDRESDTKPTDPDAQFTQTEPQIDGGIPGASLSASEDSDWTSSSGSDHSSTDPAESDSDDSAPEEMTSHRTGPDRVPPPPGEQKKRICRHFARNGRCLRGERCKFVHEMPERGPKTKPAENRGRRGILQAVSFCFLVELIADEGLCSCSIARKKMRIGG